MSLYTPDWVKHAVFYQIFPDRFARSLESIDPESARQESNLVRGIAFKPWGSPPEEQGYQGGDLLGIVEKLDYLQELGINALYLNPIFSSASNHRYHTYDYFEVDPLLGGNDGLRTLLDAAHARNMRVVLDAVYNHASRGFWAFHHVLENGPESPYVDWFHIHGWPLNPYHPDEHRPLNYEAWWGLPALPKFNVSNPGVRAYLLEVSRFWIDFGIDGWRMDVPEEINDPDFWRDFRTVVKSANPEAYIVGEIWNEAHDWLQGDRFDAVMNYVLSRAALGFFGKETLRTDYEPGGHRLQPLSAQKFAGAVEHNLYTYDWQITLAQLNLVDSHDTARILWMVDGDESALRLLVLFQMTMPGAPCVYYGDEVGMTGANDPYCRGAFPWHQPDTWNQTLLADYRRAIGLRHQYAALRVGAFQTLHAEDDLYAFSRKWNDELVIVVFNIGTQSRALTVANVESPHSHATFVDVWHGGRYQMVDSQIPNVQVPARNATILVMDTNHGSH